MTDGSGPQDDLTTLAELARRLSDRGRWEEASELYMTGLRLAPDNVGLRLGLAEVRKRHRLARGGSPNRSLRDTLREQQRRASIDAAHFLGLAYIYADKGTNRRAIECLEIAKAKEPANPAHHKLHGRILFRRKDFRGAAGELTQALRLNPFDRETAVTLGRAQYELKEFEAALRSSVHAFLLLHDGDREGTERLRRRIRTLKQILGWGRRELTRVFHERQQHLHTAFDRLEWHRERFLEEGILADGSLEPTLPGSSGAAAALVGGQLELANRLRGLALLSRMDDGQVFRLTEAVRLETPDTRTSIFEHRSEGRDLYVLEEGEVAIERPTPYGTFTLGRIQPGGLIGEVNYLSGAERSADAVTTRPSRLLRFDAEGLDRLVEESPEFGVQMYWALWRSLAHKLRATNEQLRSFFDVGDQSENFLALRRSAPAALADRTGAGITVEESDKIRLFREQGLSRSELMTLATFSRERRFEGGASVFQEGDEGDEMYVILEGRVRISKFIPGGGEEALAILGRGEFFGEMSMVDGAPRSADARAHGGALTVLTLDQETVREVLSMDPQAALEFLHLLCRLMTQRLREIDEKVLGWRIMASMGGDEDSSLPPQAEPSSA